MTDATAPAAADSAPPLSARLDDSDPPWPLRPWIMAAIGAFAGLAFYLIFQIGDYAAYVEPWRSALMTFVVASALAFVLGVERRRWRWAAGFALVWGAILGLIAWHASAYSNLGNGPFEWPFFSGILAVLIATPLFQTRRDVAPDWRFWKLQTMPYERLHSHAWTDAVIGAAGLAFTGLTFLLVLLIGSMFELIGIDLLMRLFKSGWFPLMLVGTAFGGAAGLMRERDRLVSTLQRLVMIVLAVLAPVLAVAVALFLLSLAGTGLKPLWDSGFSTAALMMAAAAFSVLLANAVIGNGREERSGNRFLHAAAAMLVVAVLPLAIIAFYSMHLRVIQYGWTPERIWGVIAAIIALAYGIAGVWAVVKGRRDFDDWLRPLQQKLAIGLALLALFLALPILDFGAISTRDQVGRLQSGAIKVEKFDWAAMAFDFGPSGRKALGDLAKSPDKAKADLAKWALATENRWELNVPGEAVDAADMTYGAKPIREKVRVLPAGQALPPEAYAALDTRGQCKTAPCAAYVLGPDRIAVIGRGNNVMLFARDPKTSAWAEDYDAFRGGGVHPGLTIERVEKGVIEVRRVERRQVFVDGKPLGEVFE